MNLGEGILDGAGSTASLNSASEVSGSSTGKEVAHECSQNVSLGDEEASAPHENGTEGGATVENAAILNAAIFNVGNVAEDPLPTSFDSSDLQHPLFVEDKIKAMEAKVNGIETHQILKNDKEGLGSRNSEDIVDEKIVTPVSEPDRCKDYSDCLVVDVDEGFQESVTEIDGAADRAARAETDLDHKEPGTKQLSKSALKQLAKQDRYREIKMQRKAVEKEKRHQETARKRREWEKKLENLTEEEKENARLEKLSLRMERKDEQKSRKEKLRQALETGQNLVIDLEFSDLMKPNEITSLIQQVMYSYAANGRAAVPGRISLTGVRGDVRKELEKISGFNNWLIHREEASYLEVFKERQADLVYLTADSENVLESLDITKIYVIGGLVDRNRWKNITLEKATRQKIATAKLPIGDHLKMMASQVLTVNQVMELLLCFLEVGDWKKSLMKVVPLRKRAAEESLPESGEK